MSKKLRTMAVWALLILVFLGAYQVLHRQPAPWGDFAALQAHLDEGDVSAVRVIDNEITVTLFGGYEFRTLGVVDDELMRRLSERGVMVSHGEETNAVESALWIAIPVLVILAVFVFVLRKMQQGGAGGALELRKSRARLIPESSAAKFDDVGGCDEAKEQLRDVVDFLKHPERWTDAGVRLPRGVLLEGPPGCGKTLLARAVAGETEARFYLVSASEFVEMFVGVGAARVRDMFEIAAKHAPSVIFIDELDAVGRRRGSGLGAGHDEREQTLNQILVCIDGFETHDRVVVIGATNRSDILDPALLRPGRFDRRVRIPPLDSRARLEVLRIHTRNKSLAPDVSLEAVAERTEGSSGADLEGLVNEAGLLAVRRARGDDSNQADVVVVERRDLERALDPQTVGARFDRVDALLIESTTQVAQPTGRALVRLKLDDGDVVEGELVWADAGFLKLRRDGQGGEAIVPKSRVRTIEALAGTESADPEAIAPDAWAAHIPDLA